MDWYNERTRTSDPLVPVLSGIEMLYQLSYIILTYKNIKYFESCAYFLEIFVSFFTPGPDDNEKAR